MEMLMLTVIEPNWFNRETIRALTTMSHIDKVLFFKVLSISVDKAIPRNNLQFSEMNEAVLENNEVLDSYIRDLLVFLAD